MPTLSAPQSRRAILSQSLHAQVNNIPRICSNLVLTSCAGLWITAAATRQDIVDRIIDLVSSDTDNSVRGAINDTDLPIAFLNYDLGIGVQSLATKIRTEKELERGNGRNGTRKGSIPDVTDSERSTSAAT